MSFWASYILLAVFNIITLLVGIYFGNKKKILDQQFHNPDDWAIPLCLMLIASFVPVLNMLVTAAILFFGFILLAYGLSLFIRNLGKPNEKKDKVAKR